MHSGSGSGCDGSDSCCGDVSIIIIIKNEKIRVTLCENAAGALYIVNK